MHAPVFPGGQISQVGTSCEKELFPEQINSLLREPATCLHILQERLVCHKKSLFGTDEAPLLFKESGEK